MSAPVVANSREPMDLGCRFDMENEELYAVKWYKDEHEFFRYMPRQQPHVMLFPVAGVHLITPSTDCGREHCKIRLRDLTRQHSSGAYRCEVSSEAPTFRLASETHNITVAALPEQNPKIEGLLESYGEGEILMANCSSSPADPSPILTWYINKDQAPTKFQGDMKLSDFDGGMVTRSISLRFPIDRKYSREDTDTMELHCVSTLPGIPLPPQKTTKKVSLRIPKPQAVNNQKLFHWPSSSNEKFVDRHLFFLLVVFLAGVRW